MMMMMIPEGFTEVRIQKCIERHSKVLYQAMGPYSGAGLRFSHSSAKHQHGLPLPDHEYGASTLRDVSVYSPAFAGSRNK